MKPLGMKAYGSIPHLPGSRMGPGDHHCHDGQARICFFPLNKKRTVLVEEKLDGSNVSVALLGGNIIPLTRAGYVANTSPYEQHQAFYDWVVFNEWRFREVLKEGERVCGEWLWLAHGTRYMLPHDYFVAFDVMRGHDRLNICDREARLIHHFPMPALVSNGPISIGEAMERLGTFGKHGAIDPVEGAVWRVESGGKTEFLAKYVRPDKVDGQYLDQNIRNIRA
jgi:ATP-dependent RNA circularization protein (DNA/RNA ligase family)